MKIEKRRVAFVDTLYLLIENISCKTDAPLALDFAPNLAKKGEEIADTAIISGSLNAPQVLMVDIRRNKNQGFNVSVTEVPQSFSKRIGIGIDVEEVDLFTISVNCKNIAEYQKGAKRALKEIEKEIYEKFVPKKEIKNKKVKRSKNA